VNAVAVVLILIILILFLSFLVEYKTKKLTRKTARDVDVLFTSPKLATGFAKRIIREIKFSKEYIDIAMFRFSYSEVVDALINAKESGRIVRIVVSLGSTKEDFCMELYKRLLRAGLTVKTGDSVNGVMHHKIAIFDSRLVITGSKNWTKAPIDNYDNILFIRDPRIIMAYKREFNKIWEESLNLPNGI